MPVHGAIHDLPSERFDADAAGRFLEERLPRSTGTFGASYIAAGQAHQFIESHPEAVSATLVNVLADMLTDPRHRQQTQSLHLYRLIADALVSAMAGSPGPGVAERCFHRLHRLAKNGRGALLRALAAASAALPLDFPQLADGSPRAISAHRITLTDVCGRFGIAGPGAFLPLGRSLVAGADGSGRRVVIKMGTGSEDARRLMVESRWMSWLAGWRSPSGQAFAVPAPVRFDGHELISLTGAPRSGTALVYLAPPGYFRYPNASDDGKRLSPDAFQEVMVRNATLLGELMACGICHDAPIPLFHNRIQRHRRDDAGRYLWEHGGRLDQWLASCRYPNFGVSGLRDFEHLHPIGQNVGPVTRVIGDHLLSLVLVTGAYFRAGPPARQGMDTDGRPVDVRHRFDRDRFRAVVEQSWAGYVCGFTGTRHEDAVPCPRGIPALIDTLIEEMGVDRHMEEIFRRDDQRRLDDAAFRRLLIQRGMSAAAARHMQRGAADIRLLNGPHLGPFNGAISVPALVDFLAAAATLCVLERYRRTRLKPVAAASARRDGGL